MSDLGSDLRISGPKEILLTGVGVRTHTVRIPHYIPTTWVYSRVWWYMLLRVIVLTLSLSTRARAE